MEQKASEVIERNIEKYLIVNAVVKRARQLHRGAKPTVPTHNHEHLVDIALEELKNDNFKIVINEDLDNQKPEE